MTQEEKEIAVEAANRLLHLSDRENNTAMCLHRLITVIGTTFPFMQEELTPLLREWNEANKVADKAYEDRKEDGPGGDNDGAT